MLFLIDSNNSIEMKRNISKLSFFFLVVTMPLQSIIGQSYDVPWLKYLRVPEVDSILNSMSVKDMVAQSIWVEAWAGEEKNNFTRISDLVTNYGIGGVIFFEGSLEDQVDFIARLDKLTGIPLVYALDAEWGTGMRLKGIEDFPYQMTLGAIQNDSLLYLMGAAVAGQCHEAGINLNLAPVADVNNNPRNPVINYRSFGEDPEKVAKKAAMYMKGMQDNGVMACAKHFPGHGDTETDSHFGLPVINVKRERFESVEFVPFRFLISQGVGAVMTAHVNAPALDNTPKLPATFSSKVITGLLKEKMGFKGLVLTDALNMAGATLTFPSGKADAEAYAAGNDVLEYSTDPEKAIGEILKRVEKGDISIEDVRTKCRKILAAKHWMALEKDRRMTGADSTGAVSVDSVALHASPPYALIRDLYADAITLIENNDNVIPIGRLDRLRIATVAVNSSSQAEFQTMVSRYTHADHYFLDPENLRTSEFVYSKLREYDIVIAGITGLELRPSSSFGVTPALTNAVNRLASQQGTIITWFGNPYGLDRLNLTSTPSGLIVAYQDNSYTQQAAVQVIFGALGASGKLPVTINIKYPEGYGLKSPGNLRLQYGFPENAGLSSEILNSRIDSIAVAGLDSMAYPGCQVLIARKGIVVFNKSYGYHTYDSTLKVKEDDLWDLASVTKVSAATPSLMLLNDRGLFDPDRTLGSYLPWYRFSNKGDMVLRDMLAHQAGMTPFIPFYRYTVKEDGTFKKGIFSDRENRRYAMPVTDSLYINRHYTREIFKEIRDSKTGQKKYVYSDLTFILAAEIIESLTDTTIDKFAPVNIYNPIGAFDITYNPLNRYPKDRIIPTEYDSTFRKQLIWGTVHDEGAAMLGGVSGHAGLFATGNDLLKLWEMYRRGGTYGGTRILSQEVLKEYTRVQFPENDNRRGLCFDKPMLPNDTIPPEDIYPCKSASPSSFGHSGFTGTFVWVDPEAELTYVFLSNHVYPTRNNYKLSEMKIRASILQVAYDSIKE
jgi:beta-glucosidase-like glycosyl hydrolase/CubicO group peptidase (beta-lactamase class C family)